MCVCNCIHWCARVHLCVCVFEIYLHGVCPALENVAPSCVGRESARVHVHLLQISFTFLLAGPLLTSVHLKHSRLQKVTFVRCDLTSVDVATLLTEVLPENQTLEQLRIYSSPEVSL